MNAIPQALREHLATLPRMHMCERQNDDDHCHGRITWEHCWTYAGRQIQEEWAIIGLCWYHHLGPGLFKQLNKKISLGYATPDDLKKYPRADFRVHLPRKYDQYQSAYQATLQQPSVEGAKI